MGSNATEICVSISVKIASLYTTRSCDGFISGWGSINSAYDSTYGELLTWNDGALVVGHRVDPIDRAEHLSSCIMSLPLLPGMKRQGDEFVSLLHLCFGLHEDRPPNRHLSAG